MQKPPLKDGGFALPDNPARIARNFAEIGQPATLDDFGVIALQYPSNHIHEGDKHMKQYDEYALIADCTEEQAQIVVSALRKYWGGALVRIFAVSPKIANGKWIVYAAGELTSGTVKTMTAQAQGAACAAIVMHEQGK